MTKTLNLQRNRYRVLHFPKAFTLVEVLVVIAIISILMTIAAIGIGNLAAGKGTSAAIATSESIFEEARSIAVSKRCKARVMIDVDDISDDRYLRRVVIMHQELDATGTPVVPEQWVLANRGYVMPQGTFFSRTFSTWEGNALPIASFSGGNITADFAGQYVYYEFNAEGIFQQPGARFVLGTGSRTKSQTNPKVTKASERDFSGFSIWRNGRTSSFRTIEQMDIPEGTTTF